MNYKLLNKIFFLFTLLIFLYSCADEETTAPTEENLLLSTSFEKNGVASSEGWKLPGGNAFSSDTPPNGGSYSLQLIANDPPEVYASIKVPVKTQYSINKLSFWAKSDGVTSNIYGKAVLSLIRNGNEIKTRSIQVEEIVWLNFSIQDTFNVAEGDSFLVELSGGTNQLISAKSYFDLVQLQGIK